MRIFKDVGFSRFARRQNISDSDLCEAVERAERGLVDADLGGGVIKQRIPRPNEGRSSGFRTIVHYKAKSARSSSLDLPKTNATTSAPTI